jgi:solute carrier family 10 (sodium/bile acid cotransporter), member 7
MKKYGFFIGLAVVVLVTMADGTGTVSGYGRWLVAHRGPDVVIFFIFLFSGLMLETDHIRSGLRDIRGILFAMALIFIVSPVLAIFMGMTPLSLGAKIGLFLVAAMPTTLSSGVVMTGAAGGNTAHALVITILANSLAVLTVPISLSLMLRTVGKAAQISLDTGAIFLTLWRLVFIPLCAGALVKFFTRFFMTRAARKLHIANQCLVLCIVWMALSQTRSVLLAGAGSLGAVVVASALYHAFLLAACAGMVVASAMPPGRRESVIFMGGQKTLPLSIIVQVSVFPEYGTALMFCVVHHVVHLLMDGYLVGVLRRRGKSQSPQ